MTKTTLGTHKSMQLRCGPKVYCGLMVDTKLAGLRSSDSLEEHQKNSPKEVRVSIFTISDTRTPETDGSGGYLKSEIISAGHTLVEYAILKDDGLDIRSSLTRRLKDSDIVITSGGTGIAGRDVTVPVVESLIVKPMPGFGEIFRILSYEQVKGAAMLSRALGGLTRGGLLFALPGSLNAVQTAWEGILKEQLGHLVFEVLRQSQSGYRVGATDQEGKAGNFGRHSRK